MKLPLPFPLHLIFGALILACHQQVSCRSGTPEAGGKSLTAPPAIIATGNYHARYGDDIVLDVRDPKILEQMELPSDESLSLPDVLQRISTVPGRASRGILPNSKLHRDNLAYQSLTELIRADLATFDRNLGIPTVKDNPDAKKFPAGNVARQFDERWLRSDWGFFLLTGVINRFDRKEQSRPSNCGEVRLIYRLVYKKTISTGKAYASRLPFFLNVVFEYPHQADCSSIAKSWQAPGKYSTPDSFLNWLRSSPLTNSRLRFKQIELNAQVVRFPAGMMQGTGGQATYLMRVYRLGDGGTAAHFEREPLENTPDVRKLKSTPQLREELIEYIKSNLGAIDVGAFRLPQKFLALEALSFSPLGNGRLANKPFNAIFAGDEIKNFSALNFEKLEVVKSPGGLMERLNNATCMGCHQGNSTAGFHFFGLDRNESAGKTNQIRIGTSQHYFHDAARRAAYLKENIAGNSPAPFNPLSYAPIDVTGSKVYYRDAMVNEFCLLDPEADFHPMHTWRCESEALECRSLVKNEALPVSIGKCVPRRGQEKQFFSGQACREGTLVDSKLPAASSAATKDLPFNFFSFKDTFTSRQIYDLPEDKVITASSYNCRPTRIGVPLGRMFRHCSANEKKLLNLSTPGKIPNEICGLVGGTAFDRCAEGNFHDCLNQIVFRGALDTCHSNRFCREDYMCQKLDSSLAPTTPEITQKMEDAQIGFCTPTYFLYQMRIDGHPSP